MWLDCWSTLDGSFGFWVSSGLDVAAPLGNSCRSTVGVRLRPRCAPRTARPLVVFLM